MRVMFQAFGRKMRIIARGSGIGISGAALGLACLLAQPARALDTATGVLPDGFVYLADTDPSIRQDMRYAGKGNFIGRPARGYEAPACILTRQAALALSSGQKALARDGLTLVVFDCYRPLSAVADFVAWTSLGGPPDAQWHPHVARGDLIARGYIGARSSHARGSTVDLAIASLSLPAPPRPQCGVRDADTLDFGSGFDCFDPISETDHSELSPRAVTSRARLKTVMEAAGFRNYPGEWWHFTLMTEPFKDRSFDFPVR